MFFILCDNWKTLFFKKVYRYSEDFSNHHAAAFLRSISKEVRILRYLHNSSTILTPNFKNKVYKSGKISLTNLIFWLPLWLFHIFLHKWFLINSKPLWKHVFTNTCQNRIFINRKSFFLKSEHWWPDGTFINNDYRNAVIL